MARLKQVGKTQVAVLNTVMRFERPVSAYEVVLFTPRVTTPDGARELLNQLVIRNWIEVIGDNYQPTDVGRIVWNVAQEAS